MYGYIVIYWGNDNLNPSTLPSVYPTEDAAIEAVIEMILADVECFDELYSEQRELGRDVPNTVSYEAWLREYAKKYFDAYDHYHEREPLACGWILIMEPLSLPN